MIPFSKYPGLSPLFLDFLKGLPAFYPDPPTLDAAAQRGREILAARAPARMPASAFRRRGTESDRLAEELAAGRAIAVGAGHQVGLFSGPLFTVMKAFDAIHLARALSQRGVPAVAVFWALTDDHDLQEIARTARPAPEGPQVLVLEGADRQNRQPVGRLPIPEGVRGIVDAFRSDANDGTASILEAFARRSAPGVTYGKAFIETLLDLTDPDPLLVLDPLAEPLRAPTAALFREAVALAPQLRQALETTAAALRQAGKPVPAPVPEDFSFFAIDRDGRRRIAELPAAAARVASAEVWPSADVITRPVLKSYLFPMAASVLGAAEIAYHAQSLPLFRLFGVPEPVLIPRTHVVLRGPAERRLAEQLGLREEDLLSTPAAEAEIQAIPEAGAVARLAQATEAELATLAPALEALDGSLSGALDTTKKKLAYQFEQLAERVRKAAERKDGVAANRHRRLAQALLPDGIPAERVYPPLTPMLTYGREVLDALRRAAGRSTEGASVVDLGQAPGGSHAG